MPPTPTADPVLIVGAGPTGMTATPELARPGIPARPHSDSDVGCRGDEPSLAYLRRRLPVEAGPGPGRGAGS